MANRATYKRTNEAFADELAKAMLEKFQTPVDTSLDLFEGRMVTRPTSKKRLSKEERDFIAGFEVGYLAALGIVGQKGNG